MPLIMGRFMLSDNPARKKFWRSSALTVAQQDRSRPMDHLTSLRVFTKVVESQSFTEAASQLGLSRAMASKHIQALENRLAVRLLNRTTRKLSLTEAGTAFYTRTAQLLGDLDDAESEVSDLHTSPRGLLKVNAPMSFAVLQLSTMLPDFLAENPDMQVELTLNDRRVDLVDEGYDMAIRIGDLEDSSLIARRIAPARLVACASPTYLQRHGTPHHPGDLAGHRCLIYTLSRRPGHWVFQGPDGRVSVDVSGPLRSNNGDILRQAAVEHQGVAIQPTFIVGPDIMAGDLVPVLCDWRVPEYGLYAVYPQNRHVSAKLRAFVDFLVKRLGPEPPWDREWLAKFLGQHDHQQEQEQRA